MDIRKDADATQSIAMNNARHRASHCGGAQFREARLNNPLAFPDIAAHSTLSEQKLDCGLKSLYACAQCKLFT